MGIPILPSNPSLGGRRCGWWAVLWWASHHRAPVRAGKCWAFLADGVPLFWLTGLLAGLLYGVPYLGMLIVVVLACGLVVGLGAPMPFLFVFTLNPWHHALLVFLGIVGLDLVFDWVVMPRLVGRSLDLRMHESILALLIGAKVAGVWGMILAIPLGALFKRLVRQSRASPIATEPTQGELSSPTETDPNQPNHSK